MTRRDPFARRLVDPRQISVRYSTYQRIAAEGVRLGHTPGVTLDDAINKYLDEQERQS